MSLYTVGDLVLIATDHRRATDHRVLLPHYTNSNPLYAARDDYTAACCKMYTFMAGRYVPYSLE